MSRPPRFSYAHAVHHATLRCNNREFLFTVPSFELFVDILQDARQGFPISLYNYCLMTNHVHLLFQVGRQDTLSQVMHWISTSFSRRFNKQTGRNGHLWEGRFRSTIIEQDSYFLRCMAYVDLNPVRAKMAASAMEYRWCGHRALRDGNEAELDFHPIYLDGGTDAASPGVERRSERSLRWPAGLRPRCTGNCGNSRNPRKPAAERFGCGESAVLFDP